jgi:hypothetical protein
MTESFVGGASAAPLSMRATAVVASAVIRAVRQLFTDLERGRRIDATALRNAMEAAFSASDASGAWNWKTAYDACEAATILFLRRYSAAMRTKAASPAAMLPLLMRIVSLLPSYGVFGEIISWKLRMFVPADASGVEVLAKVLDRHSIERIAEREAT